MAGHRHRDEHAAATATKALASLRHRLLTHPGERFHAADLVQHTEELHAQLGDIVAKLGTGDDTSGAAVRAAELAAELHAGYLEARLRFLERGVLDHVATAVRDGPRPELAETAVETAVERVRAVIGAARAGEVGPADAAVAVGDAVALMRPQSGLGGIATDGVLAPIDPWAPGTFGPPDAPVTIRVVGRSDDTLTVRWRGRPGIQDYNQLLRMQEGATWEVAATFDHAITGFFTHEDTGLDPDTRYHYRVRTGNGFGSRTTPLASAASGHTRAVDDPAVWRTQIRIRVADIEHAGGGGALQVRLQSPLVRFSPNGNRTWLDHAPRRVDGTFAVIDDLDRGHDFTYDLVPDVVSTLSDITMLTLETTGADAVAIAQVSLVVNGTVVFDRVFGESADEVLWLENEDDGTPIHTFDYPELRAHTAWSAFVASPPPPPLAIPRAELAARIEAIVGDSLHGTDARWRATSSSPVDLRRLDNQTLRCGIRLRADAFVDFNVDIRFDLRFSVGCSPTTVTIGIASENHSASVDFDFIHELLSLGLVEFAEGPIANAIADSFHQIAETLRIPSPGLCPTIVVTPDANVTFTL